MKHIEISSRAESEILHIIKNKNIPVDYKLRVTIKGNRGCAGAVLTLGFDKIKEDDLSFNVGAIPILISKKELMFVSGKRIDFYEGADAKGFHFENI